MKPLLSLSLPTLLLTSLPLHSLSKAILGVDLGSLYMKVALVQRNSPLEIVTNLHSKRKTEQMVLFDQGSRFYGADASSLMARKPHLTPSQMSVLLGRDAQHPSVQVLKERHYHFLPEYNETRSGVCLTVDGEEFTPEELVAMVLSHAKDITAAYGVTTPLKDCVLTVPAFYTQHERRALLDAAELADLNVLALINENTASALHFGIDRNDKEPKLYLFYNMGAGSVQVSVVKYHSYKRKESKFAKEKEVGSFEVLGSGWDATLGGASFDARLVDHMANEFNTVWNEKRGHTKDVRDVPRAMAKLMIQANKVKHVLSANTDFPVFVDALYDDLNYQTHISRAKFEEICHDLLERASVPIVNALKMANVTLDQLDAIEMIGGAMRVPKVQEVVQTALGGMELGMHLNSDESMALGAAFHGANVSTSFKVRHVGMMDVNPFVVGVDLVELEKKEAAGKKGLFGIGKKKEGGSDEWNKHATIFKVGSKLGAKKTIAFSMDKDVHVGVNYEESDTLPEGTGLSIEQYDVSGVKEFAAEMKEKGLEGVPKVALQFEMSTSGLTKLIKAEAVMEEIVIVEEEVEVEDDEEGDNATEASSEEKSEEAKADETKSESEEEKKEEEAKPDEDKAEDAPVDESKADETSDEKKEGDGDEKKDEANTDEAKKDEAKDEPKKKKTKKVQKEKKKKHVRALKVSTYNVGTVRPYSPEIMAESKAKLDMLAQKDKDRMLLEEAKNTYEAYIYFIRNKLSDDEESVNKVTSEEQREALLKSAEDAEEWMFDEGFNADLQTYQDRYKSLSEPAEKAFFRVSELTARPKAIAALTEKLDKVVGLMKKWETTMEHITEEERKEVLDKVDEAKKWIEDNVKAQEEADPTADPVFKSEDVPGQTKKIESIVSRLMKKPKPKPVEKNETDTNKTAEGESSDGEKKEGEETTESESSETTEGETAEENDKKKDEKEFEMVDDGDEL